MAAIKRSASCRARARATRRQSIRRCEGKARERETTGALFRYSAAELARKWRDYRITSAISDISSRQRSLVCTRRGHCLPSPAHAPPRSIARFLDRPLFKLARLRTRRTKPDGRLAFPYSPASAAIVFPGKKRRLFICSRREITTRPPRVCLERVDPPARTRAP